MDYGELTETFWNNVSRIKAERKMTWKAVADGTGHSGASFSSMRNGHKMPSMGIAKSIAQSLGTTVEALCSDIPQPAASEDDDELKAVLHKVVEGLDDNSLIVLIILAEALKSTQGGPVSRKVVDIIKDKYSGSVKC